ncbi:MAG: hypothetical protein V3U54_02965 [Thermodesulfobacteriota bacterium]
MITRKALLMIFLICAFSSQSTIAEEGNRANPYSVYSDLLSSIFTEKDLERIVITSETFLQKGMGDYARKEIKGLREDTIEDFLSKNENPVTLKNKFVEDLKVVLVTKERSREILLSKKAEDGYGWEEFYKLYPDSQGITELSRVGFSKDRMQALVYIGTQVNPLSGSGYLILLHWNGKSWGNPQYVMLWIS